MMSYDFEGCEDRSPPKVDMIVMRGDDLETIVTLLDLAAIELSEKDDFALEELLAEARDIGGSEITLNETDVRIVLPLMKTIRRTRNGRYYAT